MKQSTPLSPARTEDVEKYALRFLAASPKSANEAFSDAAADLYRVRYGHDYGDNTFNLTAIREQAETELPLPKLPGLLRWEDVPLAQIPEDEREHIAQLRQVKAGMLRLPRASVHDSHTHEHMGSFFGPPAVQEAELLIDLLLKQDSSREFDISVSDDRCVDCGELFSHEARNYDNDKGTWVCPACGE